MPFYTAGGAAAATLQDILARQSADAQQRLVNQMNERKQTHQEQLDTDTLATNKMLREAQAEQDRMTALKNWGSMRTADSPLSPDEEKFLHEHKADNLIVPGHDETISSTIGAAQQKMPVPYADDSGMVPDSPLAPPSPQTTTETKHIPSKFYGFPDQREKVDQDHALAAALADPELLKKYPQLQAALIARNIDPKGTFPAGTFHPPGHAIVYDPNGGGFKTGPELGPEDKFIQESRPPQAPMIYNFQSQYDPVTGQPTGVIRGNRRTGDMDIAPPITPPAQKFSPPAKGEPAAIVNGKPMSIPEFNATQQGPSSEPHPIAPIIARPPTAASGGIKKVPPALAAKYAAALGKYKGSVGNMPWNKSGDAKSQAESESLMQEIVNYGSTAAVKTAVRLALEGLGPNDPDTSTDVAKDFKNLSPAESQDFIDILSGVRGR